MYYRFYIDQFFLEHLLTGYLLLKLSVTISKSSISRKRMIAGSILNAAAAALCICIRVPGWYFAGTAAAGIFVFRKKPFRDLIRANAWLWLITICFGGVMDALLNLFGLPFMAGAAAAAGIMEWAAARLSQYTRMTGIHTVRLQWKDRTEILQGLIDSGNSLTEPYTGKPVSIVNAECISRIMGPDWERQNGYILIPFHSIGKEKGWMQGVTLDRLCVLGEGNSAEIIRPVLAVYKGQVSAKGTYQIILHPMHTGMEKK